MEQYNLFSSLTSCDQINYLKEAPLKKFFNKPILSLDQSISFCLFF